MSGKIRAQANLTLTNEEGEAVIDYVRGQIKKARIAADFSQRQLSIRLHKAESYISKVESGSVVPGLLEMIEISEILKTPLRDFLPPRYRDKDKKLERIEELHLEDFRKMSEEHKELITDATKKLAHTN